MADSSPVDERSGNAPAVADVETMSYAHAALYVPFRMEQVLISAFTVLASVALIFDFVSWQSLLRDRASPGGLTTFDELGNCLGIMSGVHWMLGFGCLAHWLHSIRATRWELLGCYMKIIAWALFNLQSMVDAMNDPTLEGPASLWWFGLTAALFFHIGNIVSCYGFYMRAPPGSSKDRGWLYHGNLPVAGMWMHQAATWFLLTSFVLECTFDGMFQWAPLLPMGDMRVAACQLIGSILLCAGCVLFAVWCDAFRNVWHPPLPSATGSAVQERASSQVVGASR